LFGFREKITPSPILTASAHKVMASSRSSESSVSIHSLPPSTHAPLSQHPSQLTASNLRLAQYSTSAFEHNLFVAPNLLRDGSHSSFSSASGSLSPLERHGQLPTIAKEVAESVLDSLSYTPRSASSNYEDSNLSTLNFPRGLHRGDSNLSGY
jgi:hypothetical protein